MSFEEEEDTIAQPRTRYEGEDTSVTTQQELNGWYFYPIAAEVYAVVAVGAFLPVILEQLARENGVFFSDPSKPCVLHDHDHDGRGLSPRQQEKEQCMVNFLGKTMSTSSFAMYTSAASVLAQALTLVFFSSFADHGPYRKKMLLAFSYIGSLASCLFLFITPSVYYLAPILTIIGVTSLGCSFVLLNAFLPLLVANHADKSSSSAPKRKRVHSSLQQADDEDDEDEGGAEFELDALDPLGGRMGGAAGRGTGNVEGTLSKDLERSAQISSKGVGLGYAAAIFVQVLSIMTLFLFSKTELQKRNPSLSIRVILFLVGCWWAIFTVPTWLWLRERPGPPLPSSSSLDEEAMDTSSLAENKGTFKTVLFYTRFSLRSFWRTVKEAISLRQTLLFLISWFLLSDAIATISGTAVLFARTELHMGTVAIACLSITSIGSGVVGAFTWPRVQRRFGLQPKTVLLCCVAGLELIPLYGLLGFLPWFRKLGVIGLQKAWEIYPVAIIHGIVMGGISSYARSVYAPLVPEGREAAFFALYAVTDKGSSAFGPALVGWIVDRMGTIRPAFIFLAVLVVLPAPLLWQLDVERGRENASNMAEGGEGARGTYQRVRQE